MQDEKLKRSLTLPQMIAMAAGGMIAAWMVEIHYWFELTGAGSLIALAICGALVLPLCFIYAEMTSMLPYAGGENIWISNAFGWTPGWICCWFTLLLYVMAMPTVSYGISSMLSYLVPSFGDNPLLVKIIAALILILWFVLTNFEIKFIAKLQSILFWSTLAVSLAASIILISSAANSGSEVSWNFSRFSGNLMPNGGAGFGAAIGLLIMKFVGFDMIPQLSEESDFPRKNLWKAFLGSLGLTILIYGLAIFAVGGILDQSWFMSTGQSTIVDPHAADLLGLHWLGVAIVVMGMGTCLTTLSGFWMSASRTLFGAAQQGQFTRKFAKVNKHGQPWIANIAVGILSLFFTVFAPDEWVNYIYTIYGLAAGVVYLFVAVAFMKLRKAHPEWPRPYKVKGWLFFGLFSVAFCVYVIIVSMQAMDIMAWIVMAIYIVLAIPFLLYARHMCKKDPEHWNNILINPDTVDAETLDWID